ncbi:insulin-degrading enzyme-like [Anoplolepis gracilipes]|uniref:insulin-degrading enzyme-like n=1 Tax=Anoplolepis gracilipes TaxID=354296 RepID=UPI003B9FE68D
MMANGVKKRYDYIRKSENDDRSYRGLILANEMKVLLINDPTTEKAAAALDLNIGSMYDPNNLPGLTYFLQHVLYLSEEKNTPKEMFKNYVSRNKGTAYAETTADHTNYHFDIAVTKFKDALDLFAQLFKKSIVFNPDMIKSELRHMKANYFMNAEKDKCGLTQLFKWTIENRNHSEISKLGISFSNAPKLLNMPKQILFITQEMQKFYTRYYSPHRMSLCVLSKENLDELEKLVVNLFFQPFQKVKLDRVFSLSIVSELECLSVYKICGFHNDIICKRLYVIFPAVELFNHPKNVVERFLTYLFEYDSKGSLISVLKAEGWGYHIKARFLCAPDYVNFFMVTIDLTDEGLEHIDDIMTLFIQYAKILKEADSNELRRIHNEYKEIMELKFRFKEKESSLKYVKTISRYNIMLLPYHQDMKNVLRSDIPINHTRYIIESVMNGFLSPLRMRIYIIAPKYINDTDEFEPLYLFRYKKEMVSRQTCANWWNNACAKLNLPACNEFIPTITNLKPCEDNAEKFPTVIWDTQLVRVWHKKDDVFNEPKTIMIFHFICPPAHANPVNANLTLMFIQLINNSLKEYLYPAALVDLQWELCITVSGILLKINGFDDKQYLLLEKIVDRMINFKLSPKNFEIYKQNHKQLCKMQLEQFKKDQPYRQALRYLSFDLNNYSWQKDRILESTYITFEEVQQFISNLFESTFVECLIHGNMTRAEALNIAHLIENKLPHVIPLTLIHLEGSYDIGGKDYFVRQKKIKFYTSSCTQFFCQVNERSIQSEVLLDLAQQIINQSCYNTLKIRERGDIAYTGIYRTNRIQGLTILVQGWQICGTIRINIFMDSVVNSIVNMSEKSFQKSKALLTTSYYNKKSKTLNELSSVFWDEILNQQYIFDRLDAKANYLDAITKYDLSDFVKKLIDDKTSEV